MTVQLTQKLFAKKCSHQPSSLLSEKLARIFQCYSHSCFVTNKLLATRDVKFEPAGNARGEPAGGAGPAPGFCGAQHERPNVKEIYCGARCGSHPKDVRCRFRAVPRFWGKFDISNRDDLRAYLKF